MSNEKTIFTYLFGKEQRNLTGTFGPDGLSVTLPYFLSQRKYSVDVDPRDRRALFVFDGDTPWGGLPRSAQEIRQEEILTSLVRIENVRKPRKEEEAPPAQMTRQKAEVIDMKRSRNGTRKVNSIVVVRRFLLLPCGNTLVRRYEKDTLRPIYTMIEVANGKHGLSVTCRNSTY